MTAKAGSRRELFAYLDWLPLPSRMTPEARPKTIGEEKPPIVVVLPPSASSKPKDETKDKGKPKTFRDALLDFSNGWKGLPDPDPATSIQSVFNADVLILLEQLRGWLGDDDKIVAAAIDPAGLVAIVIRAPYTEDETKTRNMPADRLAALRREMVRNRVRADVAAMLMLQLLRAMVAEVHAEDGSLHALADVREGLYSVDALAIDLAAVDTKPYADADPERVCKLLLSTDALFKAKSEASGIGGPLTDNASPSAFLSLSTRYGALVDRTLPALGEPDGGPVHEQGGIESFIGRYRSGAFILCAAFLAMAALPTVWPSILKEFGTSLIGPFAPLLGWEPNELAFTHLTAFEYGLFLLTFFVFALIAYSATFGQELRIDSQRERLATFGVKPRKRGPVVSAVLRGCAWWVDHFGIHVMTLLLLTLWLYLGLASQKPEDWSIPEKAVEGSISIRAAIKAAFWGLPAVGFTILKYGDDRLATLVKTVFEREGRLQVLGRLESALTHAQRFATNIKAAFKAFEKDHPTISPLLDQLLVFTHAKDDIVAARGKIQAVVSQAQAEHQRRAGITAALGFLLLTGGVFGKFEPQFEKPKPRTDDLVAARLAAHEAFIASRIDIADHNKPISEILSASLQSFSLSHNKDDEKVKCKFEERKEDVDSDECSSPEKQTFVDTLTALALTARMNRPATTVTIEPPPADLPGARLAAYRDFSANFRLPQRLNDPVSRPFDARPCRIAKRPAANEDPPCVLVERAIYLDTFERLVMEARLEWRIANIPRPALTVEMEDIKDVIRSGFRDAYIGELKPRLRALVKQALDEAIPMADGSALRVKAYRHVLAGINRAMAFANADPLETKSRDEIKDGANAAFELTHAGPLKPKVRELIREAVGEAAGLSDWRGIEPQAQESIRHAIEGATTDADLFHLQEAFVALLRNAVKRTDLNDAEIRLREAINSAVKTSVGEVYVGALVTRLRPEIVQAIGEALRQKYELELKSLVTDELSRDALVVMLTKTVIAAMSSPLEIDCGTAAGSGTKPTFAACLAGQIAIKLPDINTGAGSRLFMPQVPDRCLKGLKARAYFFKPYEEQTQLCYFNVETTAPDESLLIRLCDGTSPNRQASDEQYSGEIGTWATRGLAAETGKEIVVAGYADSTGRPQDNLQFAANRAKKIKDILGNRMPSRVISAIGRGEEAFSSLPGNELPFPAETPLSRRVDIYLCD